MQIFKNISKLSMRIFLIIFIGLIVPMYGVFMYLRSDFSHTMQKELSEQVVSNVSGSKEEIQRTMNDMANLSNVLVLDGKLLETFQDSALSYYEKMLVYDSALSNLQINNLFRMEDIKITFFDAEENIYTNWELGYDNDYKFLLKEDWIQESIEQKGHIVWKMFSPAYIHTNAARDQEAYISLARSVFDTSGRYIGTLILSLGQSYFQDLLKSYVRDAEDYAYICTESGNMLLSSDLSQLLSQEEVVSVLASAKNVSGGVLGSRNDRQYLISYYELPQMWTYDGEKLYVLNYTDYAEVEEQISLFTHRVQLVMVLFSMFLIAFSLLVSRWIVRPVRLLERQMQKYDVGIELQGLDTRRRDEIGSLNRSFVMMSKDINKLFWDLKQEHNAREKYQFESLKAQINPHFLFNTLGSIRWMAIIRGANNMVPCIDALSGVLKHAMSKEGEMCSLRDELESVKNYVYIQNVRYGNPFALTMDVATELMDLMVVRLILQPIVENAILHGLKENANGGILHISAQKEEDHLVICVLDNGKGISKEVQSKMNAGQERKAGEGIGFVNVNERLRLVYGEPYGVHVESVPGEYTLVTYTLPIIEDTAKGEKA